MRLLERMPPGADQEPEFRDGWLRADGTRAPYLSYLDYAGAAWSDELESLHEESSRDHFIDVLTRDVLVDAVSRTTGVDVVADLGCSTGYLLEDLARRLPDAQLIGVDVVGAGLAKAHEAVPTAALLLADVCDLPLADGICDAVVSANMLEHVADDVTALGEIARILRPGGTAALVVPFGARLVDYYDRFLGHERRYGRRELAGKARTAGLEVASVDHLGQLLYPPFWAVKKRNRLFRGHLDGVALMEQVEHDIAATGNSRLGALACRLERRLVSRGISLPVGIREALVLRKPLVP